MDESVTAIFRISRLLKIMRDSKFEWASDVRQQLKMLARSVSSIANIGCLLLIFMFVFSVLGTGFFFNARLQDNVNSRVNFQTLGNSFMTLFHCLTGENWNNIMSDLKTGLCSDDRPALDYACGGLYTARFYFFAFYVIGSLLMLNLFVAVMLNNISRPDPHGGKQRRQNLVKKFKQAWMQIDVKTTMHIHFSELENLLLRVGNPLGSSVWSLHSDRLQILLSLQIPVIGGKISYIDTFIALARYSHVTTDTQDGFYDPFSELPPSHTTSKLVRRVWRFKYKHSLTSRLTQRRLSVAAAQQGAESKLRGSLQSPQKSDNSLARATSETRSSALASAKSVGRSETAFEEEADTGLVTVVVWKIADALMRLTGQELPLHEGNVKFQEFQDEPFTQFRLAYAGWVILRSLMRMRAARRESELALNASSTIRRVES